MAFDYSKLAGRIVEKFGTRSAFAKAMGWSERTLSLKMKGRVQWSQTDMNRTAEVLDFPYSDIGAYFFCPLSSK